jgi:hypothetical protein
MRPTLAILIGVAVTGTLVLLASARVGSVRASAEVLPADI